MDRVAEVIKNSLPNSPGPAEERDRYIRCAQCETDVRFSPNQYRRYCPKCGLSILNNQPKSEKKLAIKPGSYDCLYCLDTGVISYKAQVRGQIYDYVAKCVCQAGSKMGEAIPSISKCAFAPTLNFVKHENLKLIDKEAAKEFREELARGN